MKNIILLLLVVLFMSCRVIPEFEEPEQVVVVEEIVPLVGVWERDGTTVEFYDYGDFIFYDSDTLEEQNYGFYIDYGDSVYLEDPMKAVWALYYYSISEDEPRVLTWYNDNLNPIDWLEITD